MVSPEQAPGAKRLYEIRSKILESGARCVFGEPQYDAALVATVVEGTPARAAVLDPLGLGLGDGPGLYFTLMRNLATTLRVRPGIGSAWGGERGGQCGKSSG